MVAKIAKEPEITKVSKSKLKEAMRLKCNGLIPNALKKERI